MAPRLLILSQDEFDSYLRQLGTNDCQFMIRKSIDFCSDESFRCPYRGLERFTSQGNLKECKRAKMTRFERVLSSKKKVNPFIMHGN